MKYPCLSLFAALLLAAGCAGWPLSRPVPPAGVVIVGNGRTATDPDVPGSAGWGDALPALLQAGTFTTNLARPRGTLADFLAAGGLAAALDHRPAIVVVGFGQGDAEAKSDPHAFTADLGRLVASARAAGVTPVLVTPPVLRVNDPTTGKPAAGVPPPVDAQVFADAVAQVARATGATLLDLRAEMQKTYKEIGDRSNWFLHPPLDPAKEPATNVRKHKEWRAPSRRRPDYFSVSGAESLAHWLANLLRLHPRSGSAETLPATSLPGARNGMAALLRSEDGPPAAGYDLTWRDEFDGAQLDTNSWACRHPGPRKDGINDPACLRVDGEGHLVIDIKQVDDTFHAGILATAGRREWTHGYFECRMTLARDQGFWNAFWLMADTVGRAQRDPAEADQTRRNGTEIDVMEYLQTQGDVLHLNLHWNGYGDLHRSSPFDAFVPGFRQQEWHVFGVDWTTEGYAFYVDGRHVWTTRDAPSDVPQHIILSVEIGKWAGDIKQAKLPQSVKVDWVRVWQKPPLAR